MAHTHGHGDSMTECVKAILKTMHIVLFGKFHKVGGVPPETFPDVKHDDPEEVGGDRKCFDSLIRK